MRRLFLGPYGLRSGYRIAIFFVSWIVLSAPIGIAETLQAGGDNPATTLPARTILGWSGLAVVPAFLVTWILVRLLDRRPLATAGFPRAAALRDLGLGVAAGVAMILLAILIDAPGGHMTIVLGHPNVLSLGVESILVLMAASHEEIVFRGYPFQWLVRGIGFPGATAVFSILFAAAHLFNPGVTVLSFSLIVISGIWLALARIVSKGLWLPIGLHFGWNAAQGILCGIPVSGLAGLDSAATVTLAGKTAWSGGDFGLEGTVGAVVVIAISIAALAGYARTREIAIWRGVERENTVI